jgi:hypothetical protein
VKLHSSPLFSQMSTNGQRYFDSYDPNQTEMDTGLRHRTCLSHHIPVLILRFSFSAFLSQSSIRLVGVWVFARARGTATVSPGPVSRLSVPPPRNSCLQFVRSTFPPFLQLAVSSWGHFIPGDALHWHIVSPQVSQVPRSCAKGPAEPRSSTLCRSADRVLGSARMEYP